jgi:hypothetical protein
MIGLRPDVVHNVSVYFSVLTHNNHGFLSYMFVCVCVCVCVYTHTHMSSINIRQLNSNDIRQLNT